MLSGTEQLQWIEALSRAFSPQEFTDLLFHRLDERVYDYAAMGQPWKASLGDVVDAFSRRDWEFRLIAKAIEARPANAALLRLASGKKAAIAPDEAGLESLIRNTNSFLNLSNWLDAAGKLQVCVCRIEIPVEAGTVHGTGFLVAPDLVMTNWHVMRCVSDVEDKTPGYTGPRGRAASVRCRFDYKVLGDGKINPGSPFAMAKDWRVALAPMEPRGRDPEAAELDCALLRLEQRVGELSVGDRPGVPGDHRGWIRFPATGNPPAFAPHSPLFMIQHPQGDPLKLALETDGILSVNANRTRVLYSTNSVPGSSGSPCFDQNWNLVALHHRGDPNFASGRAPESNEGIPIDTIATFLKNKNVTGVGA
jgi:hypothetical protein